MEGSRGADPHKSLYTNSSDEYKLLEKRKVVNVFF